MTRAGLLTFFAAALTGASCLFVGWHTLVQPWREARLQLADLTRASGRLQADTIRYGQGKATGAYLAFTLAGQPQDFGLWASQSEQTLDTLRAQLHPGQQVVVYYDPNQADVYPSSIHFNLYQLEADGRVLLAWEEKHRDRQQAAGWSSGLVLLLVGLPILFRLRRRATA